MPGIVHILLSDLRERLDESGIELRITSQAVDFLAARGYDDRYGARPLRRAIRRYIEDPLSEKILMAEFGDGDEIEVDVADEGESLVFTAATPTKT